MSTKSPIKDPTKPPSHVALTLSNTLQQNPNYELTAIFSRDAKNYAVVNGTILSVGDKLANMLVTEISHAQVTMNDKSAANKQVVLELSGSVSIKKQVSQ